MKRPDVSKRNKRSWKTSSYKKKMLKVLARASVKAGKFISMLNKENWKDSNYRARMTKVISRHAKSPKGLKIRIENLKKANSSPKLNNKKHRRICSKALKRVWVENYSSMHTAVTKAARTKLGRKIRSRTMRSLQEQGKLFVASPSKIQVSVFRSLCGRGVSGVRIEYRIGSYKADITDIVNKIAIEIDGEFWHSGRKSYLKRRCRDRFLKSLGWKIVHVRVGNNCDKPRLLEVVYAKLQRARHR